MDSFNPAFNEQQKRERTQKEALDKSQANIAKSWKDNIGEPSPDGTPEPKRQPSKIGKIVIRSGLAAVTYKLYMESTKTPETLQNNDNENDSNDKNKAKLKNADPKLDKNTNNPLLYFKRENPSDLYYPAQDNTNVQRGEPGKDYFY